MNHGEILRRQGKMIEALTRRTIMEAESPKARVVQPGEGLQYNVMVAMMTYKATAQDTRGAYSLAIEVTPPHGGLPLHVHHQEDEAMYFWKENMRSSAGTKLFGQPPGHWFSFPRISLIAIKTWGMSQSSSFTSRLLEDSKSSWRKRAY